MFPSVAIQLIQPISIDMRENRIRSYCATRLRMDMAAYFHLPINRDQFIP